MNSPTLPLTLSMLMSLGLCSPTPSPIEEGERNPNLDLESLVLPCANLASTAQVEDRGDYLVLDNLDAEALLIMVPGAEVDPSAYVELATSIQRTAATQLSIAIVRFPWNSPNPVLLGSKLNEVEKDLGFEKSKTFLSGHSLGGIFSRPEASSRGYAGLILMGSYLANGLLDGSSSSDSALPVLTLGGELDGLTRITRIALSYQDHLQYAEAHSAEQALSQRPVFVIPGVNHVAFADGVPMDDDIPAEISLTTSHLRISSAVSAFVALQVGTAETSACSVSDARAWMGVQQERSQGYFDYYLSELATQSDHCIAMQDRVLEGIGADYAIANRVHDNQASFLLSKPNLSVEESQTTLLQIETHSYLSSAFNPMDISTEIVSATQIACKMKSRETVLSIIEEDAHESMTCADMNSLAFEQSLAGLSESSRERYEDKGWQVRFEDDLTHRTGATWSASGLEFEENSDERTLTIRSSRLTTSSEGWSLFAGMHYCKLLSPARALEWMMVDSLR